MSKLDASRQDGCNLSCKLTYPGVDLLQAAGDEEVQDGDDVALVAGHRGPQPLHLRGKGLPQLQGHVVQALQQLLAPVVCASL